MTTITPDQQQKIKELLNKIPMLSVGIGTRESACSLAAINLALSGELKDEIPECMSAIIGKWIIVIQDAMPADLRNSTRWRELLPLAAGTGRAHEKERLAIIMNWMWETVLPQAQGFADKYNFGPEWKTMCAERTARAADAAANAAAYAAHAARAAYAAAAADAADAAYAAAAAARAAHAAYAAYAAHAAYAALAVADAANAARAATDASYAAAAAANVADATARAADDKEKYWTVVDPCGLLEKLIAVTA